MAPRGDSSTPHPAAHVGAAGIRSVLKVATIDRRGNPFGAQEVAAAIPPKRGRSDSLTVRRVNAHTAVVRDLRGDVLWTYWITRNPGRGWLARGWTVRDIRCPDGAAENARPGQPIERA